MKPPIIEYDPDAEAVYVRFRTSKVSKVLTKPPKGLHIAFDVSRKGSLVGIEIAGKVSNGW